MCVERKTRSVHCIVHENSGACGVPNAGYRQMRFPMPSVSHTVTKSSSCVCVRFLCGSIFLFLKYRMKGLILNGVGVLEIN
jgi:hypothetical protein